MPDAVSAWTSQQFRYHDRGTIGPEPQRVPEKVTKVCFVMQPHTSSDVVIRAFSRLPIVTRLTCMERNLPRRRNIADPGFPAWNLIRPFSDSDSYLETWKLKLVS